MFVAASHGRAAELPSSRNHPKVDVENNKEATISSGFNSGLIPAKARHCETEEDVAEFDILHARVRRGPGLCCSQVTFDPPKSRLLKPHTSEESSQFHSEATG